MTRIGGRDGIRPRRDRLARQYLQPILPRQPLRVDAQLSRQGVVDANERRMGRLRGRYPGEETIGKPGVAVVKGQGHEAHVVIAPGCKRDMFSNVA